MKIILLSLHTVDPDQYFEFDVTQEYKKNKLFSMGTQQFEITCIEIIKQYSNHWKIQDMSSRARIKADVHHSGRGECYTRAARHK